MKLLATTRPSEWPSETLLARLRSRRAQVNTHEVALGEAIDWVYRHLNKTLRKRLEPFLDLLAMQQLILLGRYQLAGEPPPESLQSRILLAAPLREVMAVTAPAEARVGQLEAALVTDYAFARGLRDRWQNQGPGGFEQQLVSGILQRGLRRAGPGVLTSVLRYLVDMRNLLSIAKFWRWQVHQSPPLLDDGALPAARLQRVWAERDEARFLLLAGRRAGEAVADPHATRLEQALVKGLSRLLRRAGRDPLSPAVIIDYLWRVQQAAHNRLLEKTLPADRSALLTEVLLP
ncbi:MAG: hypothetical protein P8Y96_09930 [Desulfuromonadales bacterium]|jgi:hypothetical protein